MALPGFHAEASLRPSARPYPSGPRREHGGDLIVPMWTTEQLRLLRECSRYYDSCETWCTEAGYPTYDEWQSCNVNCSQSLDTCLATLYDGTATRQ